MGASTDGKEQGDDGQESAEMCVFVLTRQSLLACLARLEVFLPSQCAAGFTLREKD